MKEDRGWRHHLPERAYRDAWLLIITVLIVFLGIKALDAATTAQRATREIQKQRIDTIWTSCNEQNHRHDRTIAELHRIAAQVIAQQPRQAKQIRASIGYNVLLIDQLAPDQNCRQVVARATSVLPPIQRQYPPVIPGQRP